MNLVVLWTLCIGLVNLVSGQEVYDVFFGKPVTDRRRQYMLGSNATGICTIPIQRCKIEDGRRVDGTCTNPKFPSRGSTYTPLPRLLPAKYGPGNAIRPARDGTDLPSPRLLRTTLLPDGFVNDHPFTQLASHYFVFAIVDSAALDDILTYAIQSDCCVGNTPNRVNPRCNPIPVPENDPYLRLTGVRCMNLTRALTFQDLGCIPNSLPAERANRATPLLDLSPIYGNTNESERTVRSYQDGLLRFVQRGSRETPPTNAPLCINNRIPAENACYEYGDFLDGNSLIGTNLLSLWFYRQHNRFARKLKDLNPCWDDQQLFQTAKDINIAVHQNIFYYELMVEIIGRKNALHEGVIYDTEGYVNDFDARYEPGVILEYLEGSRWFHTFQDAQIDLYNRSGKYVGTQPMVEVEFRSGIFEINETESLYTQGSFRQASGKFDYTMDPDLSERLFAQLQTASDLPAIDIMRGRDFGLQPYNAYRKYCGLPVAKTFEDFEDTIDKEKVKKIKRLYEDVDDVEFMTAIYTEKLIPGGWVGPTLYCALVRNLLLWRRSDLYFFEHGDHPNSFTLPQLQEIRKSSIAKLACNSGDRVTRIQPKALLKMNPWNELKSCDEQPDLELEKWYDPKCSKDYIEPGFGKDPDLTKKQWKNQGYADIDYKKHVL